MKDSLPGSIERVCAAYKQQNKYNKTLEKNKLFIRSTLLLFSTITDTITPYLRQDLAKVRFFRSSWRQHLFSCKRRENAARGKQGSAAPPAAVVSFHRETPPTSLFAPIFSSTVSNFYKKLWVNFLQNCPDIRTQVIHYGQKADRVQVPGINSWKYIIISSSISLL